MSVYSYGGTSGCICSFQNTNLDSQVNTAYIIEEIMQKSCFNDWLMFYLSSSFIVKKAFKIRLNDQFLQERYGVPFPGLINFPYPCLTAGG